MSAGDERMALEERPELEQSYTEFQEAQVEYLKEVSQLEEALQEYSKNFIKELLQFSRAHEIILGENMDDIEQADKAIAAQTCKLQELKTLLQSFHDEFTRSIESEGDGSFMRN